MKWRRPNCGRQPREPLDLTPYRESWTPLTESPFVGADFCSREIERFDCFDAGPAEPR